MTICEKVYLSVLGHLMTICEKVYLGVLGHLMNICQKVYLSVLGHLMTNSSFKWKSLLKVKEIYRIFRQDFRTSIMIKKET